MDKMNSFKESSIFYSVKFFGFIVRRLPLKMALWLGRMMGTLAYYWDVKHKSQAYANLKVAFSHTKSSDEIKKITKNLFQNYGQNLIELFRMPLMNSSRFEGYIKVEGKEHVGEALKKGKGVILLAMHFGSWELASLASARLGFPYKVMVRSQKKYSRLDDLLNAHRAGGGYVPISRGLGTRDFVKSLKNNEVVGMVVDQGGRDGVLVPFFGRQASMSVGALRMGLRGNVPICFCVIIREQDGLHHRMVIHQPFDLENTGNLEQDIAANLKRITKLMEGYICQYPSEYMWFYKIWKYSKEANITILSDGKMGHLRQSQAVACMTQQALAERGIETMVQTIPMNFRNRLAARGLSLLSFFLHPLICQGRLEFLKWFLSGESFRQVMAIKADFIISCGSSVAGVNYLLSHDHHAKSIVILRPGLLGFHRFHLVVLPQHDTFFLRGHRPGLAITHAAPNRMTPQYLEEQSRLLLNRFSHLKDNLKFKIGLLFGGDSEDVFLSEPQIKVLLHQIKDVCEQINADILATTSRRTPARIEQLLQRDLKKDPRCALLILANQDDVPQAVGGILGLADIIVVSGDSISMISEAASSGKNTIVFLPQTRAKVLKGLEKHRIFMEKLHAQGFILSSDVRNIGRSIYDIAKNKIQTRTIDDHPIILEAVRKII